MSFVDTYTEHFQSYCHDVSDKARQFARGLMQVGSRKNMDRMAEVVPKSNSRNLQQFLTHSKWSHKEVIDHVTQDVDKLLGNSHNAFILVRIGPTFFEEEVACLTTKVREGEAMVSANDQIVKWEKIQAGNLIYGPHGSTQTSVNPIRRSISICGHTLFCCLFKDLHGH